MEKLEYFVNQFKGKEKRETMEAITNNAELTREEKCYLYYFLFPRPLLDRELPSRIEKEVLFGTANQRKGYLTPCLKEICLLIEACKTPQYSRFMKHVFHAFTDNDDYIYPILGEEKRECPICGKTLLEYDNWLKRCGENGKDPNREYLAFGSTDSRLSLCLDCIVQLKETRPIIDQLEPDFLDWRKRDNSKSTKLSWEDLKL